MQKKMETLTCFRVPGWEVEDQGFRVMELGVHGLGFREAFSTDFSRKGFPPRRALLGGSR